MQSLGFEDIDDVTHHLNALRTKQHGKLNWEEFLDFFGARTNTYKQKGETWWKTEEEGKQYFIPIKEPVLAKMDPEERKKQLTSQAFDRMNKRADGQPVFNDLAENKKADANMHKLAETRVNKLIIQEIEQELENLKRSQGASAKGHKMTETVRTAASLAVGNTSQKIFKAGPK